MRTEWTPSEAKVSGTKRRRPALKREAAAVRAASFARASEAQTKARSAAGTAFRGIRWGAFTADFRAYAARHPKTRAKTLRDFAALVLRQPGRHAPITVKRARFYVNLILPRAAVAKKEAAAARRK
jgi:hypothetical protein